jgi:hypothetical protein
MIGNSGTPVSVVEPPRLDSERDRRVHAAAAAATGLAMGAFAVLAYVVDGAASALVWAGYLVLLVGATWWQRRAARTVPRHATRTSSVGAAASGVLLLVAIVALHVLRAEADLGGGSDLSRHPLVLLGAALVVAAPALVAARLILRGPGAR